jgi:PKD repeat protein
VELATNGISKIGVATPFTVTRSAGSNVTLEWDFGDGSARERQGPGQEGQEGAYLQQHTYQKPGMYTVTVEAQNSANRVIVYVQVEVLDVPDRSLSVLLASADGKALRAGSEIIFRAEAQHRVEALLFLWDFGDGAQAWGPLVRHAYARQGTYEVRLVVSGSGYRQAATVTAAILPADDRLPTGDAIYLPYVGAARN